MRGGFLNKREQVEFMTREYNDRVIQTRVSSLTLANAMLFLKSKGVIVSNQSSILREVLKMCANIAVNDPNIESMSDYNEAVQFVELLNVFGRSDSRGEYSSMRAMQQYEAKVDAGVITPKRKFNDGLPETWEDVKKQIAPSLLRFNPNMTEEELNEKTNLSWNHVCSVRSGSTNMTTMPNVQPSSELTDSERNDLKAGKVPDSTEFNWNDADKVLNELSKPQVVVTKKEENSNG